MMTDAVSLEGQFLVAMPGMEDARFDRSVIFVCAHSPEGAMGFVVNRKVAGRQVTEFFEHLEVVKPGQEANLSGAVRAAALRTGGPVEPGRGFVLHSPDYEVPATVKVTGEVYLSSTMEILHELAAGRGPGHFLLMLGYSGWGPGQIENEIAANGWLIGPADADIIFDGNDENKYQRAMGLLGVDPDHLSADAGHA